LSFQPIFDTMSTGFNAILDQIANSPDVRGAMLLDAEGLCLATRGLLSPALAAPILAAAFRATSNDDLTSFGRRKLERTIAIAHGRRNIILIRQSARLTLAILKPNPRQTNGHYSDSERSEEEM